MTTTPVLWASKSTISVHLGGNVCMHAQLTQSCPILCDPMDCNTLGSSFHWILQGKNTGVGFHALLQVIFPTQGLNQCLLQLLHCRKILYD